MHDLVDALGRDADRDGELVLGDTEEVRNSSARISPGWIGAIGVVAVICVPPF
jgi:hypothetical protein